MNNVKIIEPIVVDIKGLQAILKLGKTRAMEIGVKSGAKIKLSERCTRYDVEKVRAYVRELQKNQEVKS